MKEIEHGNNNQSQGRKVNPVLIVFLVLLAVGFYAAAFLLLGDR